MGHKRVICLLSKEPEIQQIMDDMKDIRDRVVEQAKFLDKKMTALKKQFDDTINLEWERMAQLLIDRGHLKQGEYVKGRDELGVDTEGDAVWFRKDGQHDQGNGMPDDLKEILRSLLGKG